MRTCIVLLAADGRENTEIAHQPDTPISFSVVERKVLTPPDAASLDALAERIIMFRVEYEQRAHPFEWRFTRADLGRLLHGLAASGAGPLAAAAEYITECPGQST